MPPGGPPPVPSGCRPRTNRRAATPRVDGPPDTPTNTPTDTAPKRTISDAKGTSSTPGTTVRTEGGKPTGDPAADEAYEGLGSTFALYSVEYHRDSLDGKGMPLLATVHYGTQLRQRVLGREPDGVR